MTARLLPSFLAWLAVIALMGSASAAAVTASSLTYEKHIRPILKAHCFLCHGEGDKLRGGLDLRQRRLLVKGGKHGSAVLPGKRDESLLFQRVRDREMPPSDNKLAPDEVDMI